MKLWVSLLALLLSVRRMMRTQKYRVSFARPRFDITIPTSAGSRAACFLASSTAPPRPVTAVLQIDEARPSADSCTPRPGLAFPRAAGAIVPMIGHTYASALSAQIMHARKAGGILPNRHAKTAVCHHNGNQRQWHLEPHLLPLSLPALPLFECWRP